MDYPIDPEVHFSQDPRVLPGLRFCNLGERDPHSLHSDLPGEEPEVRK
jgi:hypothetical protein